MKSYHELALDLYSGIRKLHSVRLGKAIVTSSFPAVQLGRKILGSMEDAHLYLPFQFLQAGESRANSIYAFNESVSQALQDVLRRYAVVICILPFHVVIHEISVLLNRGEPLPLVLFVDAAGKFIVHLPDERENEAAGLISELAKITGGQAVYPQAGWSEDIPPLDRIARQERWKIDPRSRLTQIMAGLAVHEKVALVKDADLIIPEANAISAWTETFSDWQAAAASGYRKMVVLTCRSIEDAFWQNVEDAVVYFLPRLVIGVNFARTASGEQIIQAVATVLQKHALAAESVVCLAAAEKQQDAGLVEASSALGCPVRSFSRERIHQCKNRVDGRSLGKPLPVCSSAAEAAALLASGAEALLVKNQVINRIAVAVAALSPAP